MQSAFRTSNMHVISVTAVTSQDYFVEAEGEQCNV
jgi:hypothetical protein